MRFIVFSLDFATAGLLIVTEFIALFSLPSALNTVASEPEDLVILLILIMGGSLGIAAAFINGITLFRRTEPHRIVHVLNILFLGLIAALAITSVSSGTASEVEKIILIVPGTMTVIGYAGVLLVSRK